MGGGGRSARVFQKSVVYGPDFREVAEVFSQKCSKEDFCSFTEIARRIWFRRNAWVHDGDFLHPVSFVEDATRAIEELHRVLVPDGWTQPVREERIATWMRPPVGWCKVNVDAALNAKTGRMGFGIIVRDSEGKVRAAKSVPKVGLVEPAAALTMAVFYGVSYCHERGIPNILVEGDAKQVIDAIEARGRIDAIPSKTTTNSMGEIISNKIQRIHLKLL